VCQSREALDWFVTNNGTALLLSRVSIESPVAVLRQVLMVLTSYVRQNVLDPLRSDAEWFEHLLRIPENTADPAVLAEVARFLPAVICVFTRHWPRVCKLAGRFLDESLVHGAADDWLVIQRGAIDTFCQIAGLIDPKEPDYMGPRITLLSLGFHDALLRSFTELCDRHKIEAACFLIAAFSMVLPPDHAKLAAPFDVSVFIEELLSENSKVRLAALMVLEAAFEDDGENIWRAMDLGLGTILVELTQTEQFDVKVQILELVNRIVGLSGRDCDREPFATDAFLELLIDLIEDDRSRELHNAALTVACSLYRTLREGGEWYGTLRRLIEKEPYYIKEE
jgi:hypothetical protein